MYTAYPVVQKYIFITGGVVSSLGKGLTAASIALLLESRGIKVSMLKVDPYLNVDPGTMNPYQHGEVYVTDDGAETDLDLGHYYRFTNAPISKKSNMTTGQIYSTVIDRERHGDYLGTTVQVVPHVTNEIKKRIKEASAKGTDVTIVEIGGTVGDIESQPFLEAIRQFRNDNSDHCINIHLTYVPYLRAAGELKSKPTQHSVNMLQQVGIIPDILLCRCEEPLPQEIKDKIALFCSVKKDHVIDEPDVEETVYEVPMSLKEESIDEKICKLLGLRLGRSNLRRWEEMLKKLHGAKKKVVIGLVGKYVEHQDAYKSVIEALRAAGIWNGAHIEIKGIESDKIQSVSAFAKCDGILIPGGFGERGWEGKILAAKYCREKKIPFLGICLGMQAMAVEFARHALKMKEANSTEVDPTTPFPVISLLSEQKGVKAMGGTMRLGVYTCQLLKESKVAKLYKKSVIQERHRHRYEFNNAYLDEFEKGGMLVSGKLKGKKLCEIMELKKHPFMVAAQFHPEFQSKPTDPHPLFMGFIGAACGKNRRS